jgi:hypothetical protein
MTEFKINEFGEIIRDGVPAKAETPEDKLMDEYVRLDYEVNHLTRPTQDPEKIARYKELKRILNIGEQTDVLAYANAKAKLKLNQSGGSKNIFRRPKEND